MSRTERTYNSDDPLFLASCSLDEPLNEREQRLLDDWISQSKDARGQVRQFQALQRVLRRWAAEGIDAQSASLVEPVVSALRDQESDSVDRLLAKWGTQRPEIDWEEYGREVGRRIRAESRRFKAAPWIIRLGAPLAVAAALAFAWITYLREPMSVPSEALRVVVNFGPDIDQETRPGAVRTAVSFARMARTDEPSQAKESLVGMAWVSASRGIAQRPEAPPL